MFVFGSLHLGARTNKYSLMEDKREIKLNENSKTPKLVGCEFYEKGTKELIIKVNIGLVRAENPFKTDTKIKIATYTKNYSDSTQRAFNTRRPMIVTRVCLLCAINK